MINLPLVTMVIVDTINYGGAIEAIRKSLTHIKPARTILFTDVQLSDFEFEVIQIQRLTSKDEYSHFIVKKLGAYISTDYVLIIQSDGYVLDGQAWTNEFLNYDYIGAPWLYKDGRNVGNGGFTLRTRRLHTILMDDDEIKYIYPEDEAIGRLYRAYLERKYNIKFAPDKLAHRFSFELHRPVQPTFGFHGNFHQPYKPQVILSRSGAMGDIVMMEPVMEWFYTHGYEVILDIPPDVFLLFQKHFFDVYHVSQFGDGVINPRLINLDMSYENKPEQLVLKSYYEFCGISNGTLKNPRIKVGITQESKLFDRYCVLHVDSTTIPHRDVHGVDWARIVDFINRETPYKVFQVGNSPEIPGATKIIAATKSMLAYIIGGADLFIGIDSGPSQIAVACNVKSMIFFGSVNPAYRYADLSNIKVIQNQCPAGLDGCYHKVISVRGQDCPVDSQRPPCITHSDERIMDEILTFL